MKWVKGGLVIFGAVLITALGIDASDTLQGNDGTLLSQIVGSTGGGCPEGMVSIDTIPTLTCVDIYEVSPGKDCPFEDPSQILNTRQNIETNNCKAISKSDGSPWRFVTRDQAMELCARNGKRLPTSAEWYSFSMGIANAEKVCNVDSGSVSKSGSKPECITSSGLYDTIGNLWEWVSDDVIDGMYNARSLPQTGYVQQVDAHGVATVATGTPSDLFGNDYFWSVSTGAYAIIRGGYYESGTDAGIYAVHADTLPTTAGAGIGFRCVK